jgi:hypothetical protein
MAVIQGKEGYTADVDGSNSKGLNIETGLRQVMGSYRATGCTGVVAAPTSGGNHFVIKNGGLAQGSQALNPAIQSMQPRKMYITYLRIHYWISAATTVHSPLYFWNLVRFSQLTALSGGTQLTGRPIKKRPWGINNPSSTQSSALGEIRVNSTTAGGLTVTGGTYEVLPLLIYPQPLTAPTIGNEREVRLEMNGVLSYPIEVPAGGGIAVQLLTGATPTTHGFSMSVEVEWFEGV